MKGILQSMIHRAQAIVCAMLIVGCSGIIDDRIPAVPVNVNLADAGLWNTYGVSGMGQWREFVKDLHIPSNFSFTAESYTGFGGILLISGMDPFSGEPGVPLAYDLSCPVECSRDIRVTVDADNLEAYCAKCGSRYDVLMAGGAPVKGPAAEGSRKYKLQGYRCVAGKLGGYTIRR